MLKTNCKNWFGVKSSNNMIIGFGGTSFTYICAQGGQWKKKRLCACPDLHSTPVIGQPQFGSKSDLRRH